MVKAAKRQLSANKVPGGKNLLTRSDFPKGDGFVKSGATSIEDSYGIYNFKYGLYAKDNTTHRYAYVGTPFLMQGKTYVISMFIKMEDSSVPVLGLQSVGVDLSLVIMGQVISSDLNVNHVSDNVYRISGSYTITTLNPSLFNNTGFIKYPTQSNKAFTVSGWQIEEGATATPFEPYTERNRTSKKIPAKNLLPPVDTIRYNETTGLGVNNTIVDGKLAVTSYNVAHHGKGIIVDTVPGKLYTYSGFVEPNNEGKLGAIYIGTSSILGDVSNIVNISGNFSKTFTATTNKTYIKFNTVSSTALLSPVLYSNIQLEEGATATPFEPYTERNRTSKKIPAKNLLPAFNSGKWTLHANATVKSAYELELNATGTGQTSDVYVNVLPSTNYKISFTSSKPNNVVFVQSKNSAGVTTPLKGGGHFTNGETVTSLSDTVQLRVMVSDYNTPVSVLTISNPQLELGNTATPFEPYREVNKPSK